MLTGGSVEWIRAGEGVWHAAGPVPGRAMRGYQLWLALPAELEHAPAESLYLEDARIETDGPARVLLGSYGDKSSLIPLPVSIAYLHVRLKDGERWIYLPGSDHDVAWLALNRGCLHVGGNVLEREMAVFADGAEPIEMLADGAVEFVIGSSARHPHPLITGYHSVHTSPEALAHGERNIAKLERTPAVAALRAG